MPKSVPLCRQIRANGHRCDSPALRGQDFCFFHSAHHKDANARRIGYPPQPLTLQPLENRQALQVALFDILEGIASGTIERKRAGLLLYGIQIAASLLPRESRAQSSAQSRAGAEAASAESDDDRQQLMVEEPAYHPIYGPIAAPNPPSEAVSNHPYRAADPCAGPFDCGVNRPPSGPALVPEHNDTPETPGPEHPGLEHPESKPAAGLLPAVNACQDPAILSSHARVPHSCPHLGMGGEILPTFEAATHLNSIFCKKQGRGYPTRSSSGPHSKSPEGGRRDLKPECPALIESVRAGTVRPEFPEYPALIESFRREQGPLGLNFLNARL